MEDIGSSATKGQVSTWMDDCLVGCAFIVRPPYIYFHLIQIAKSRVLMIFDNISDFQKNLRGRVSKLNGSSSHLYTYLNPCKNRIKKLILGGKKIALSLCAK